MAKKISFYIIGTALLLLGFQNCGGVTFSEQKVDGVLTAKETGSGSEIGSSVNDEASNHLNQDGTALDDQDMNEDTANNDDSQDSQDDSSDDSGKKDHQADNGKKDDQEDHSQDHGRSSDHGDKDSEGARLYVCVLAGSGKSMRLGYVDGKLVGKKATPQDVCMTKQACEEIVSKAFDVKMAQKRGFCPDKNPHVVNFSDAQLEAMIDEMLKK